MPRDYRNIQAQKSQKDTRNPRNYGNREEQRKPFEFTIDNFFDEKENIKSNLISNYGEKNVEELSKFISAEGTRTSQIRKFYDSFLKSYNNFLNLNSDKEDIIKIQLMILKAQVEYSFKRRNVKPGFKDFIDNRFNLVLMSKNFKKDFKALKSHFEILIAYLPKN